MKKESIVLSVLLIVVLVIGIGTIWMDVVTLDGTSEMYGYNYEAIQSMVSESPVIDSVINNFEETEMIFSDNEQPLVYDVDVMLGMNEDFCGWLLIPETVISLPVVQCSDNSFYLNHSFTGEYCPFGCLFLDTVSYAGAENRVIHGHNMGSNRVEMFSSLVLYQDPDFADAHRILFFSEPGSDTFTYQIFAVLNFDLSNLGEHNYFAPSFEGEEREDLINYLKEKSIYDTEFYPEKETLILSTCNREFGKNNRLLICAGLVSR